MNLALLVQDAAVKAGIARVINNDVKGVLDLAKHCDLSYERTVRIWKGDKSAKLADVELILNKLGYKLKAVPIK